MLVVFKFSDVLYCCGWKNSAPHGTLLRKLEGREKSYMGESQARSAVWQTSRAVKLDLLLGEQETC